MEIDNKNVETLNTTEKTNVMEENITHVQIIGDSIVDSTTNDTEISMEKQFTPYVSASSDESQSDYETASDNGDDETNNLADKFSKLKCNPTDLEVEGEGEGKYVVDDILAPVDTISKSDESFEDEDDENDDNGWITPGKFNFINQLFSELSIYNFKNIHIYRMSLKKFSLLKKMVTNRQKTPIIKIVE